ncbi:hypothetical protein [Pseudooceanicola nanhaiensis]|uniref:hypothetical protein n=1 Tax=Pseudooceanicola nanhaiensis TaxID=375761 RepID=UPI0030087545
MTPISREMSSITCASDFTNSDRSATDGYYHSAATLAGEEAISGGASGLLLAYGPDGAFAGEFRGHTGDILALAAAPSAGRLLSAAA